MAFASLNRWRSVRLDSDNTGHFLSLRGDHGVTTDSVQDPRARPDVFDRARTRGCVDERAWREALVDYQQRGVTQRRQRVQRPARPRQVLALLVVLELELAASVGVRLGAQLLRQLPQPLLALLARQVDEPVDRRGAEAALLVHDEGGLARERGVAHRPRDARGELAREGRLAGPGVAEQPEDAGLARRSRRERVRQPRAHALERGVLRGGPDDGGGVGHRPSSHCLSMTTIVRSTVPRRTVVSPNPPGCTSAVNDTCTSSLTLST